MKKTVVLVALAVALSASPVIAKEGMFAGAYLAKTSISGDASVDSGSETGYGFRVGMGFNRYFSVEGTYEDVKDLTSVAADFRVNFPLTSLDSRNVMTVEPYLTFGYGMYELGSTNSVDGSGAKLGVGVELYLFHELSIHAGWSKANVTFDATGGDIGLDIKTVEFGLIYHFI